MKLSELKTDYRIAIIGDQGTGKTYLAGTFAHIAPTLIVTADVAGLDSLHTMDITPEIILIEDWNKVWEYYRQIADLSKTYKVLVLDDLGKLQDVPLRDVQLRPRGKDEEKMKPDERNRRLREAIMLGNRRMMQNQWGELSVAFESFLWEILALPFAVKLVTILQDVHLHPRSGQEYLYPDLLGGIRYNLLSHFSLVANTFVQQHNSLNYFCLTTLPHPRISTKDRYSKPRTWVKPTALKLMAHITRKEDEKDNETVIERQIGVGELG